MDLLAQRDAVDELHRDELHAIVFANLMDVRDVPMIERCRGLRLLNEAAHAILIGCNFGGKNLQPDLAM